MISDSFLSYLIDKGDPYATCCLLKEEVLLKTRLSSIVSQPKKVDFVIVVHNVFVAFCDVVFIVAVVLGVIFVAVVIIVGPKLNLKFS